MDNVKKPFTMGALVRVLSAFTYTTVVPNEDGETKEWTGDDLFELRPTQSGTNSRNYRIAPIITAGGTTPWTSLSVFDQWSALAQLAQAYDEAGFGHPEVNQPVISTLRARDPRSGNYRPQLFINEKPFDREGARVSAQTRRVMQEGTPEQREAVRKFVEAVGSNPEAAPDLVPDVEPDATI